MMQNVIKLKIIEALTAEIPLERRNASAERTILVAVDTLCSFIPFDQWKEQGLYNVSRTSPAVKS